MSIADVEKAKAAHPAAKLLVHPECLAEVSKAADYIGSTTGIIDYAKTAQTGNLSSELKTAYCSTYSMSALKELLSSLKGLRMPQYEAHYPDGCIQLC